MNKTANHHIVPKSLLRAFCTEGQKLFFHSKRRPDEGVGLRDIGKKFLKRHFYSTRSLGEYDDRIERDFFQVLDSKFASVVRPVILRIVKGSTLEISDEEDIFIKFFIYFQKKRTPEFLNSALSQIDLEDLVSESIARFEAQYGDIGESERERLKLSAMEGDILHSAKAEQSATVSEAVWPIISTMTLCFGIAAPRTQFVIGTNPVVRYENSDRAFLGDGNVELWLPLSPSVAVGLVGPLSQRFGYVFELNPTKVRKMNEQVFQNSSEVGAQSERLLRSLVSSRTLVAHRH